MGTWRARIILGVVGFTVGALVMQAILCAVHASALADKVGATLALFAVVGRGCCYAFSMAERRYWERFHRETRRMNGWQL